MKLKDFKAIFTPFAHNIYFSRVFADLFGKDTLQKAFTQSLTILFIKDIILLLLLEENIRVFTIFVQNRP